MITIEFYNHKNWLHLVQYDHNSSVHQQPIDIPRLLWSHLNYISTGHRYTLQNRITTELYKYRPWVLLVQNDYNWTVCLQAMGTPCSTWSRMNFNLQTMGTPRSILSQLNCDLQVMGYTPTADHKEPWSHVGYAVDRSV